MEEGSKEIVVECVDDGFKGFVETLASHTLHDLRQLLADEFDDDMLPTDYYFSCDDIRYSTKQEAKKRVWDLIDRDVAVRIHDKSKGQKRGPQAAPDESNDGGDGNKKLRTSNDGRETTTHDGSFVLVDSSVESSGAAQEEAKATRISTTPTSFGNLTKPSSAPDADKILPATTEAAASKLGTSASLFHEQEDGVTSHSNKSISAAESSNQRGGNDVQRDPAFATTSVEETPVISNKSSDVMNKRYSSALSTVKMAILFASEPRVALPNREENSSPRLDDAGRGSASTGRFERTSTMSVSETTTDTAESRPPPSTAATGTSPSSLSSSPSNDLDATNDIAESNGSTAGERPSPRITPKPPSPSPSSLQDSFPVGNENDDGDDDDDDDDDDVVSLGSVVSPLDDANAVQQEARDKSIQVLNDLQNLLKDNPLFCSQERREDLSDEIRERLASSAPRVVVGVLGSTGVGKSR
jgi:hypothetical protein